MNGRWRRRVQTAFPAPNYFYEHVHLTFPGNYVLARAIAEKVEKALMLPESAPWPDMAQCAQRLGHTPRDTQLALSDMLGRLADVPFTFQANHDEQMRRLTEAARAIAAAQFGGGASRGAIRRRGRARAVARRCRAVGTIGRNQAGAGRLCRGGGRGSTFA